MLAVLCHMVKGASVQRYLIEKEAVSIGRSPENDIIIDEQSVSLNHAIIEKVPNSIQATYRIRDLDSTNHTFVNNEKITEATLCTGDLIRIGMTVFQFVNDGSIDLKSTMQIKKSWIPGIYYRKEQKD